MLKCGEDSGGNGQPGGRSHPNCSLMPKPLGKMWYRNAANVPGRTNAHEALDVEAGAGSQRHIVERCNNKD